MTTSTSRRRGREDIQFRFQRAPWLIEGRLRRRSSRDNIRLADAAMKERLGIAPAGFRTPGGFTDGLATAPTCGRCSAKMGYSLGQQPVPGASDTPDRRRSPGQPGLWTGIVRAQAKAQPFVYPTGLIEVPMSPISDVTAFRTGRWPLEAFLEAIRAGVTWAIEQRAVFCFLGHPSCLVVTDPEFRTIDA